MGWHPLIMTWGLISSCHDMMVDILFLSLIIYFSKLNCGCYLGLRRGGDFSVATGWLKGFVSGTDVRKTWEVRLLLVWVIHMPYLLNWKLKKFSWAKSTVSFAGFKEFASVVILKAICWFPRNYARFRNTEFNVAMAFHKTLLKSKVSSPKSWFPRSMIISFLNYVYYDLNWKLTMYMYPYKERHYVIEFWSQE